MTLSGETETDVTIIGAGRSLTALHLAKAGKAVTVLEALMPLRRLGTEQRAVPTRRPGSVACFGDAGERFVKLIGGSAAYLFDLVRENGLNCEAEQNGWIQPAHTLGRFGDLGEPLPAMGEARSRSS